MVNEAVDLHFRWGRLTVRLSGNADRVRNSTRMRHAERRSKQRPHMGGLTKLAWSITSDVESNSWHVGYLSGPAGGSLLCTCLPKSHVMFPEVYNSRDVIFSSVPAAPLHCPEQLLPCQLCQHSCIFSGGRYISARSCHQAFCSTMLVHCWTVNPGICIGCFENLMIH